MTRADVDSSGLHSSAADPTLSLSATVSVSVRPEMGWKARGEAMRGAGAISTIGNEGTGVFSLLGRPCTVFTLEKRTDFGAELLTMAPVGGLGFSAAAAEGTEGEPGPTASSISAVTSKVGSFITGVGLRGIGRGV